MTADPLAAVLDQLAAHREHLRQVDDREAGHFTAISERLAQLAGLLATMSRTLADDTAALARLEALDRQVTELAAQLAGPGADGKDWYEPGPAPAWCQLTPAERQPAVAELRAWVEEVYRPGYGHLAATLAPAGTSTTCACTGSTSPASCGWRPPAAPACCRPRPNPRPASCPPSPPS
jgi:hypothetical protein